MMVFYVLLYYVWRKRYEIKGRAGLIAAVYGLAAARVILCMMPQNQWMSASAPLSWGIYRNIPFALMGLLIIVLFYRSAKERSESAFRWMWLTIVLSGYDPHDARAARPAHQLGAGGCGANAQAVLGGRTCGAQARHRHPAGTGGPEAAALKKLRR